ncbi:MAG: Beta-glucuronidase [Spirochaetes bacterium ADurb.Bin315]|nr:MAG: Beta-glucuronidase [Spirochaetes bacterium ADurb.Bin315]
MLYPKGTPSRVRVSLDGIWNFELVRQNKRYNAAKPMESGRPMPVPSAYNDIYEGRDIRDHVGMVVYERFFDVPKAICGGELLLVFGAVAHKANVFLNGQELGSHYGGFLPFSFNITDLVKPMDNRLTVLVDNIVDHSTLPCGTIQHRTFPGLGETTLNFPNFDFFNYCGIIRPVCLYAIPKTNISDIMIIGQADGSLSYTVRSNGEGKISATLMDGEKVLFTHDGAMADTKIDGITPWSVDTPKLYRLKVTITAADGSVDEYSEQFGFRTIEVKDCGLYLNGEKIYLRGFGKHEDVPVLGRGFCEAYNVKDLALMKWMGANSFRTSHYPYSEEMMRLCDEMGILVIDETPAVGMHTTFTATGMKVDVASPTWKTLDTAEHHRDVIRDMIGRDKNHPSVIMFSIANEPASEEQGAYEYFEPLFKLVKQLDPQQRPVTFATHGEATVETCEVASLCDIIMLNRYFGWYSEEGNISAGVALLSDELDRYHAGYPEKPIMLGEFGADAIAGFHDSTALMFSEEFQKDLIEAYCRALDEKSYIVGEHVWNFADFATAESIKRAQGNKKGVFTRDRKPKLAAWYLKDRWLKQGNDK